MIRPVTVPMGIVETENGWELTFKVSTKEGANATTTTDNIRDAGEVQPVEKTPK